MFYLFPLFHIESLGEPIALSCPAGLGKAGCQTHYGAFCGYNNMFSWYNLSSEKFLSPLIGIRTADLPSVCVTAHHFTVKVKR